MFGLLFVFVVLLGIMNVLNNTINKNNASLVVVPSVVFPTSNFVAPTNGPTVAASLLSPSPVSNIIFTFNYPVKFETNIIDYLPETRRMIVYYPGSRVVAEETMKKFFNQYGVSSSAQLQIEIGYVGTGAKNF